MRYAGGRPIGRLCCWAILMVAVCGLEVSWARAAADPQSGPATTTVTDTVYQADGSAAQGNLIIEWPAFVTANGAQVAAGSTSTALASNGTFSVALVPNAGAVPAGVYYTIVYQIGPGGIRTEYWVVPTTSPANLAAVRTTPGSGVAGQPVSVQYVNSELATKANDSAVVHLAGTETISGAKTFAAAPSVPAPTGSGQVANKGYVNGTVECLNASTWAKNAAPPTAGPQ
jgi:trimeric autotransporter adhesin